MDRAYSGLTIKRVDDDQRIIEGVATSPAVDRVGDIIEPLGVKFTNPSVLLWQHDHGKPVGTVNFDRPTKAGVTFRASIAKIAETGILRDRTEEAWSSIKAGLIHVG